MGRKGGWFSSVKKALSPDSKAKTAKKEKKSKKWFGREKPLISASPNVEAEGVNLAEVGNEQTKHAYSVMVASAAAAAAAVQAAAEVVRLAKGSQFVGISKEEAAAIKVQTAFRGYLARRALRALRGLVRLKSLVDGPTVNRQTANTLKCLQNLSRMQTQIQSRRTRMLEENRELQRQLLQKRAKELESLRMGDEWDDSQQSKEKIEANLLHRYEAAMRRERALAYSYIHQQTWKKSSKPTNFLFMDPTNPHWGWSWLERWMAAQPRESETALYKNTNIDPISIKSTGEITKSFARRQLNSDHPSSPIPQKLPNHQSPANARKSKPPSPRGSVISQDNDSRSMASVQSELNRRHSIAGLSVRDDESMASSPSLPSYMVPTQSTKAKTRLPSPLATENGYTPEKASTGAVSKRLSFPSSPARPRRHSGPPRVDTSTIINNGTVS